MSELNNHYQSILKDIEENIKDEKELQFVKSKINELSMMFMDVIDRLTVITDLRIKSVEEMQEKLDSKLARVQKEVDGIQNDIYEDDDNYEFEIVCPYCNYEFSTDIDSEVNTEIKCPECNNIIELDWNCEDEGCLHECSHCDSVCEDQDEKAEDDDM